MTVPAGKAALLEAMRDEYRRLSAVLARVPPERAFAQELDGHAKGSRMSAADLMAYLLGWQALVLKWHRLERDGLPMDFPDTGYRWNQLGLLAQKFYRDYGDVDDWARLCAMLDDSQRQVEALVESYSDEALYGGPWYDKWTRGRMIQFNTASPCRNARGRLAAWLKTLPAG
ncbi:ClbS/DfsB family four-helix bundle protein [Chromobacterium haemolyticum]|uniref:ClbS/DfsB family four-helix bundle protein n=1 Tax=Chromobacterium haemolyticum TaxID=394935 RepID=UPI004056895E